VELLVGCALDGSSDKNIAIANCQLHAGK
jgi:hypothetical protein